MKPVTYEGKRGWYNEDTQEFFPKESLEQIQYDNQPGLLDPKTQTFYPVAPDIVYQMTHLAEKGATPPEAMGPGDLGNEYNPTIPEQTVQGPKPYTTTQPAEMPSLPSSLSMPTAPTEATLAPKPAMTPTEALNVPGAVKSSRVAPGMPTNPQQVPEALSPGGMAAIPQGIAKDVTGIASFPVGVTAGIGRAGIGLLGGDPQSLTKGLDIANQAMQKLTYQPTNEQAKIANPAAAPFAVYDMAVDAGAKALGLSPEATAGVKLASMALILAAPEAVRAAKTPLKTWYYGLTNKERGLIVLTYDDLKARGYTDAELARRGFFREELAKRMATEQRSTPAAAEPTTGTPPPGGPSIETPALAAAAPPVPETIAPKPETIVPPAAPIAPKTETIPPKDETIQAPSPLDFAKKVYRDEKDLTPDQVTRLSNKIAFDNGMPGFYKADYIKPYMRALWDYQNQTRQPVSVIDADIGHVSGMNSALGHAATNEHLKAISEIFKNTVEEIVGKGKVDFGRHGGDEIKATAIGVTKDVLDRAAQEAKIRIEQYAKDKGLENLTAYKETPEGKIPITKSVGLHINTADMADFASFEDFQKYNDAKAIVEEVQNVNRKPSEAPGVSEPSPRPGQAPGSSARNNEPNRPAPARGTALPAPEEITHNPYAGENKWPSGNKWEVAPFDELDYHYLPDIRSFVASIEAPGKKNPNGTTSTSALPPHLQDLGMTKAYYNVVQKMIDRKPVTWNQYIKVKRWIDEHKIAQGWRPGQGFTAPMEEVTYPPDEVPFERGGYADLFGEAGKSLELLKPGSFIVNNAGKSDTILRVKKLGEHKYQVFTDATPEDRRVGDTWVEADGKLYREGFQPGSNYVHEIHLSAKGTEAQVKKARQDRDWLTMIKRFRKDQWDTANRELSISEVYAMMLEDKLDFSTWPADRRAAMEKKLQEIIDPNLKLGDTPTKDQWGRPWSDLKGILEASARGRGKFYGPNPAKQAEGFKLTAPEVKAAAAKPTQEGLDLGLKGADLAKPAPQGQGVDINETPLGKATNEAADRAKQGSFFEEGGYDLSKVQHAMELPEIVRLTKKLIGKYPNVNPGHIKVAMGLALGFFRPMDLKIVLSSKLNEVEGLAERVLAHELGHATDYSGAPGNETMGRGNILGRIASLRKYMKDLLEEYPGAPGAILTDEDRARFQAEAAKLAKEEEEARKAKQGNEGKVLPEDILAIWRDINAREKNPALHDYISRLSDAQKKKIVKDAMKGISDINLRQTVESGGYSTLQQRQKEIYQDLIRQEILKRNLYEKETVMKELKKLTQIIKPFDEATAGPAKLKYRYSSEELYADAISTLINDPNLLKDTAPTFRKAFLNYLERKPEFKAEWERLQEVLKNEPKNVLEERQQNTTEGYHEAEARIQARQGEGKIKMLHELYKALVEKNADLYAKAKEVEKSQGVIEDTDNPRYWVDELPYINGPIYVYLTDLEKHVMEPARKLGITIDQIGEYFERMRETTERAKMANPGGMTAKTAADALGKLKEDLGPEKFHELQKMYRKAQTFWQNHVIKMVDESGMWNDVLAEYARNNDNYATFQHVMEFTGKLEEQLGPSNTARVYRQIGTYQNIRNPFIATVMKGCALMRAAQLNMAKQNVVSFLAKNFGAETIQKARGTFNGKWTEFAPPRGNEVGMITFLDHGKARAFYVPKGIAETFENEPHMARVIMNVWNLIHIPLRNILVSRNPLWMIFNVPRDFLETWKNVEHLTAFQLLKRYVQAAPMAVREVFKNEMTPQTRQMFQSKELVIERQYGSKDTDVEHELDNLMRSFGLAPKRYDSMIFKPIMAFWEFLGNLGQLSERVSKIAGSLELQSRVAKGEIGPRKKSHMVRMRIGTPDIHAGGSWKPLYNNVFLFSNVSVQGFRASWESFKEHPAEYLWKTVKYNLIPKIMLKLAAAGLLGATIKKIIDGVSEYYKTNYQVVPVGLTASGKSVVLTFPQDYTGTIAGSLAWKMMNGKVMGPQGVGQALISASPYGLSPWINVGVDAVTIMQGRNPYDDYRGQTVVPEEVFRAKDWRTAAALLKYEASQLGANAIYKFESDNPSKIKTGLEKVLDYPPGNILGRMLKVTDYGHREQLKDITEPVDVQNARRSLDVKDAIFKSIKQNGGQYNEAAVEETFTKLKEAGKLDQDVRFRQFRARYNRYASGRFDDARIDAFIYARSSEEKAYLLQHFKETLPADQYDAVFNQLIEEGFLKRGTIKHLNQLQEEGGNKK